jgi:hypothetical protein
MDEILLLISSFWAFLSENWGNLASVFGAALTVFFSLQAATAAKSARLASEATRGKLQSIDLLSELNRLNGRIDDLLYRLETNAWPVVSERATDLRVSIAAVIANNDGFFSREIIERMTLSVSQFRNIASGADRGNHPEQKTPDAIRYRKIVTDQKETLVLALEEVKKHLGERE